MKRFTTCSNALIGVYHPGISYLDQGEGECNKYSSCISNPIMRNLPDIARVQFVLSEANPGTELLAELFGKDWIII
jgi:hypothetical protein